jgi:hypothetical protein
MQRRSLLASLLAVAASPAFAQGRTVSPFAPQVDYAIDGFFGKPEQGKPSEAARIWRTRNAIRYEARGGVERHVVARLDLDKAWLSLPSLGVNFETDLSGFGLSPAALRGDGFRIQPIGDERMEGQPTTKLRMTRTAADPGFDGFAWVDSRNILWRLQGAWRFANVAVGPVARGLVEAPAGRIVPVAGEALVAMLRRFGMVR